MQEQGIIVRVMADRGFGFIRRADLSEAIVYVGDLLAGELVLGARATFDLAEIAGVLRALCVRISASGEPAMWPQYYEKRPGKRFEKRKKENRNAT